MAEPEYYVATDSGVTQVGDEQIGFRKGEIFSKDHVILKGKARAKFLKELFKPAVSLGRGDVEEATAKPGTKRGEKK